MSTDNPVEEHPVPFSFCLPSDCLALPAADGMSGRGQVGRSNKAGGGGGGGSGIQGGGGGGTAGGGGGGTAGRGCDGPGITDDCGSWFFSGSELPASTESPFLSCIVEELVSGCSAAPDILSELFVDFKLVSLPRSCFRVCG